MRKKPTKTYTIFLIMHQNKHDRIMVLCTLGTILGKVFGLVLSMVLDVLLGFLRCATVGRNGGVALWGGRV